MATVKLMGKAGAFSANGSDSRRNIAWNYRVGGGSGHCVAPVPGRGESGHWAAPGCAAPGWTALGCWRGGGVGSGHRSATGCCPVGVSERRTVMDVGLAGVSAGAGFAATFGFDFGFVF